MAKRRSAAYVPWRLLIGVTLISLVLMVYFFIKPGPRSQYVLIVNLQGIFFPLVLGILCVKGTFPLLRSSTEQGVPRAARRFTPLLLGMAFWMFSFSQLIWFVSLWPDHQPPGYPAPQHFIDLLMYPFLISAIVVLPSRSLSALARLRLLLDGLLIMAAFTTLCYYFLLAPILVRGHGTVLEKIVASIFTQLDLVMIFCLLLVILRGGEKVLRPVLFMLTLMVTGFFFEHVGHLSEILYTTYDPLSRADGFLYLAAFMMTGAAQTVRRILERGPTEVAAVTAPSEQADPSTSTSRLRTMLPSALVLLYSILVFWIWITGGKHFPGQIFIVYAGGFVVLLLMILRQFLAWHEVNVLQKTLQSRNRSLYLLNQQLEQQAIADPLTGLFNHQALAGYLANALVHVREEQDTCSLLFIDIDYFKHINDEYGHLVGDMVLRQFGHLVASMLRSSDYLGRWGGEEFVAVLPGAGARAAYTIAERIRLRVAQESFTSESEKLRLTCSVGIATAPDDANEEEELMRLADAAMYMAKRRGRNQARMAREPEVPVLGTVVAPEGRGELNTAEALMALQGVQDYPTGQHEQRVASLSLCLARSLGLSESEACVVGLGGLLHDFGKVAVPDTLLREYEQRTGEETSEARWAYPVIGAEMLRITLALHEVATIVRSHQEHMDGSGYPDRLRGEEIPLGARIVAVADAYDVLTHQQFSSSTQALCILQRHARSQFDPQVVCALQRMLSADPSQPIPQIV